MGKSSIKHQVHKHSHKDTDSLSSSGSSDSLGLSSSVLTTRSSLRSSIPSATKTACTTISDTNNDCFYGMPSETCCCFNCTNLRRKQTSPVRTHSKEELLKLHLLNRCGPTLKFV